MFLIVGELKGKVILCNMEEGRDIRQFEIKLGSIYVPRHGFWFSVLNCFCCFILE